MASTVAAGIHSTRLRTMLAAIKLLTKNFFIPSALKSRLRPKNPPPESLLCS